MKQPSVYKYLRIDYFSATPKYLQLADAIIRAIGEGHIPKEAVLPSINELSFEFEIARDTAEKAYRHLKKIGILGSVPGKGYYVATTSVKPQRKIFLLFNKLSAHKKIMYDAIVAHLGESASIDFYVYNNDFDFFQRLIQNAGSEYSHYVIIPHFLEGGENVHDILNKLPKEKLILLDKLVPGIEGAYGAVYENFEKDIYGALEKALPQLQKYHTLKIIFPEHTYHPAEIIKGFQRFCQQYAFNSKVVHHIAREPIKAGEVYINLMEDDLVTLIEKILTTKLLPGKHVGIISYNETPLKKIILKGVTTISTDFQMMGEQTAELILQQSTKHIEIPFSLTLRPSL